MESRLSRSQALQRRIHCEGDLLCQSRSISHYSFDSFIIDLINIRCFLSHAAELNGHLKLNCYAQIFAINDTFLDKSVKMFPFLASPWCLAGTAAMERVVVGWFSQMTISLHTLSCYGIIVFSKDLSTLFTPTWARFCLVIGTGHQRQAQRLR